MTTTPPAGMTSYDPNTCENAACCKCRKPATKTDTPRRGCGFMVVCEDGHVTVGMSLVCNTGLTR